jgi:hypothetical protein
MCRTKQAAYTDKHSDRKAEVHLITSPNGTDNIQYSGICYRSAGKVRKAQICRKQPQGTGKHIKTNNRYGSPPASRDESMGTSEPYAVSSSAKERTENTLMCSLPLIPDARKQLIWCTPHGIGRARSPQPDKSVRRVRQEAIRLCDALVCPTLKNATL